MARQVWSRSRRSSRQMLAASSVSRCTSAYRAPSTISRLASSISRGSSTGNTWSKYRSTSTSPAPECPGTTMRSRVRSPPAITAPMRSPSTGMSSAPSPADQSTSNQFAYGESGPSARTDHSSRLCHAGVGTAMWFGTMSTIIPRPRASAAARSRPSASRPPSTGEISLWSTTS